MFGLLNNLTDVSAIRQQLGRIQRAIVDDPALAVGSAKELIESTAKVVLTERGLPVDEKADLPALVREAQQALGLHHSSATPGPYGSDAVKKILGAVSDIAIGLAELRNRGYGTGHGPDARSGSAPRIGLRQARSVRPHLLFTVDASQVDLALVRSFLELDIEENFTVEYKRNGDAALDAVAAMANTYGGMILVGVDANSQAKDRPGPVVGVPAGEKEKFVNKATGVFDPPWWCPEVIPVPTGDGNKVVLVVRVAADRAPRPILHKGSVLVRLDGRNATADRRVVRALFEESGPLVGGGLQTVSHWPDQHKPPFHRLTPPPDAVVRAVCSYPLRGGPVRPRLGGNVAASLGVDGPPSMRLISLLSRGHSGEVISCWQLDDRNLHSRFLRVSAGHGTIQRPVVPGARIECGVELTGVGPRGLLEVCVDALFWLQPGERLPSDDMIQAAHEVVYLLTQQALPAATTAVLGEAMMPVPPVELHIAGRTEPDTNQRVSLEQLIDLDGLGQRVGTQPAYRAGEFLRQDLIDAGDWHGAVNDALTVMAMDWKFLKPLIS